MILTFDDGYADFAERAWPVLKAHGLGAVIFPVAGKVGGTADWDGPPAHRLMDWATLRRLAGEGVEVGSHGLTHRPLSRLSLAEVHEEAVRSRDLIAQQIGRAPEAFCYPYGLWDMLAAREVASAGYSLALSCAPGPCPLTAYPFHLPRIEVAGADTLADFGRKLRA